MSLRDMILAAKAARAQPSVAAHPVITFNLNLPRKQAVSGETSMALDKAWLAGAKVVVGRVYAKTGVEGLDLVTINALRRLSAATNLPLVVTSAIRSEGVHKSPGVVDLRARGYTRSQRFMLLKTADAMGWATKDLGPSSEKGRGPGRLAGFDRHIHAVLREHPLLTEDAKRQVRDYMARDVLPEQYSDEDNADVVAGRVRMYTFSDEEDA